MGPAGMPKEAVARIQSDVAKAVQMPDVRERLRGLGAEPIGSTGPELVAAMRADYDRYGDIVRRLKLKVD
jgi:tripartite-type tricarboxylate transporter receptor subunit TctC